MQTAISGIRRALATAIMAIALLAAAPSARAAEPSAAGLWQKVEDGKPVGWFLVVERDGIFEGAITPQEAHGHRQLSVRGGLNSTLWATLLFDGLLTAWLQSRQAVAAVPN